MTSYSKLQTHRECAQKYHYKYIQNLESLADARSPHPIMGSWWHLIRACDSIERGAQAPDVLEVEGTWQLRSADVGSEGPLAAAWALLERWERSLQHDYRGRWGEAFGEQPVDRLRGMDREWRHRWGDETANEEPLFVELEVSRKLPNYRDPLDGRLIETDETLTGFIDEVYRDKRRGFIVLRDHKTHTKLDAETSTAEQLDSQLQLYAWAAQPVLTEAGLTPRAVAYDRVRSTAPKQPQVTKAGKLSASIKDYSILTYLDWLARHDGAVPFPGMKKDGSAAGVYELEEKVIDNLSDPASRSAWAQRSLIPLNNSVIKSHLSAATLTYLDSTRTERIVATVGEAPRTFTRNCKFCDYSELCRAQMVGGNEGEYDLESMRLTKRTRRGRHAVIPD